MTVRDFNKARDASVPAVFLAAEYLHVRYNCSILVNPQKKMPDSGNVLDQRDDGDIIAYFQKVVEVKEKPDYRFTSADDFPFDTIMVSNVEAADRHHVDLWIIVSGDKVHAAVIRGKHKQYFLKKEVWCPNTHKNEWKYMCPIQYVEFVNLKKAG
jgi:hypothetical protein